MELLSAAQSRELDRLAIQQRNVAGSRLMANAGAAVLATIERIYPHAMAGRIAILCGGGNNGGDGLVLARLLRDRRVSVTVFVFAPAEKFRGDAASALNAFRSQPGSDPIFITEASQWSSHRDQIWGCELLIDALFGTGLVRPVRSWLGGVIEDVNRQFTRPVLAVDIPSGLGADGSGPAELPDAPVMCAERTVTFATAKLGHFLSAQAGCVGALEIADIGIPADLRPVLNASTRLAGPALCGPLLAPRRAQAHKGDFGHVLVMAGSVGKSGAAVMASYAALRMGAGLVTAAVPRSVLPIVASAHPEVMTEPLPETGDGYLAAAQLSSERLARLLAPATVLAIGPGLTAEAEASAGVRQVLSSARVPVVLDADGLNAFAGRRSELRPPAGGVLTPHPGEMARLFDVGTADVQARRIYYVQRLAAETGAVAVLKGHPSLVADPAGVVFVNPTGNPGMATGGAGDVLTGLVAGLLAQFPERPMIDVAAAAVYLHGRAGDVAASRLGEMSVLAGDIVAALPEAIRRTANSATEVLP